MSDSMLPATVVRNIQQMLGLGGRAYPLMRPEVSHRQQMHNDAVQDGIDVDMVWYSLPTKELPEDWKLDYIVSQSPQWTILP